MGIIRPVISWAHQGTDIVATFMNENDLWIFINAAKCQGSYDLGGCVVGTAAVDDVYVMSSLPQDRLHLCWIGLPWLSYPVSPCG